MMTLKGYGIAFWASVSGDSIHFVGYASVLIQTSQTLNTTESASEARVL